MVEAMQQYRAQPPAPHRRRVPHAPLRGSLKIDSDDEVRHVAGCLGRIAAELFIHGLVADGSLDTLSMEPLKEAA